MFVPSKVKPSVPAVALALALALGATSFSANAGLERMGPASNAATSGGYPEWFQDTTGRYHHRVLRLETSGGTRWPLVRIDRAGPLVCGEFPEFLLR
jgi:hypothetical protein